MQNSDFFSQIKQNNQADQTQFTPSQAQPAADQPNTDQPAPAHLSLHNFESTNNLRNLDSSVSSQKGNMKSTSMIFVVLALLVALGGVGTGYGLNKLKAKGPGGSSSTSDTVAAVPESKDSIKSGQVFGSQKAEDFKDSAEGYVEAGGTDSEGSHKLLRDGGPSKTVYMTSSSTDLDQFVGMKVKVWGETNKAQKVGWLMDVGRLEVLETKAEPPQD